MVEEWGCSLGEDAFLSDEEAETRPAAVHNVDEDDLEEIQGEWELHELVDDLRDEWCKHDGKKTVGNFKHKKPAASVSKPDVSKDGTADCEEKQQQQLQQTILQPVNELLDVSADALFNLQLLLKRLVLFLGV